MFEWLPNRQHFIVYPVENNGRWVSNRVYAVFVPAERLTLTEMMLAPGEYEFKKNGDERGVLSRDSIADMHGMLLKGLHWAGPPVKGVYTAEGKKPQEVVYLQAVDSQSEEHKIMLDKDHYDLIMSIHPDTEAYIYDRIMPAYFFSPGSDPEDFSKMLALCMGIKYWKA